MRGYGIFILWPCIFYYIRVFLFHDGGTLIGIYFNRFVCVNFS